MTPDQFEMVKNLLAVITGAQLVMGLCAVMVTMVYMAKR